MSKFKDNVPGFPGYHVTKDGNVYSMKCKSGKRPEAFKLKPRLSGNGYYRIGLDYIKRVLSMKEGLIG